MAGTPRSKVKNALRNLWLRSRERAAALKRDQYTCQSCLGKQSKAKGREFAVEVHHAARVVDWERLVDMIYERLLVSPDDLLTLCPGCHDRLHGPGRFERLPEKE